LTLEILNAKQVPLKVADVRAIVEIEAHPKTRKWLIEYAEDDIEKELKAYKKFFRNLPKNKKADILVAKQNGRVVGFLGLWRLGKYMEHVASIGVSVHPDDWGKGVATELVNKAVELAKEKGFKRLEIETLSDNMAMRHIAEKLGFKLESLRKSRIQKDGKYHDEADYFILV